MSGSDRLKRSAPDLAGRSSRESALTVLMVSPDTRETEVYSELIREIAQAKMDVVTTLEGNHDWISKSLYNLIILDVSSMDTDGLMLLERIKRSNPAASVILMSDKVTVEQAVTAVRMGAEDYLKKPFHLESFMLAIKRGMDRKAVFGENQSAKGYLHLVNSCQLISASLEQSKIFRIVQGYFAQELRSLHSAIYTLEAGQARKVSERSQDRAIEEVLDIAMLAANPLPAMAESVEPYRFIDRSQLTPALFVFPFRCSGPNLYFYVCLSPQKPEALEAFENCLRLLRRQLEVTGNNIEHYLGVEQLAYVDDATGLYNTRYLNYVLDREIAQFHTTQKSFAVLFIDADRFKGVNDTHGHLVGTKLLHELGEHLKRHVREADTVFRYGGDEFVAVLSPCDLQTAKNVAERFRQSIQDHVFLKHEGLNIQFTVSIGVAVFPDHARNKKDVIAIADHAMYKAKKISRNAVTVAERPEDAATQGPGSSTEGEVPGLKSPKPPGRPERRKSK